MTLEIIILPLAAANFFLLWLGYPTPHRHPIQAIRSGMSRLGVKQALWLRFFPDSRPATGRTVGYPGSEKVTMPRQQRWTVLGAALLALLVLVAFVWFPPVRLDIEAPTADSVHPVLGALRRYPPARPGGKVARPGGFRRFGVVPRVPLDGKRAVLCLAGMGRGFSALPLRASA